MVQSRLEPSQADPWIHGEAAQAQQRWGSLWRPGHCNKVGVPSGGAPFIFPALGTALHCAPAPCRHRHLQAAAPGPALGLCQHQEHSTVTPEGAATQPLQSPIPSRTAPCTHPSLVHIRAGSHIPAPTCAHPAQVQASCWLTRGEISSGFSAPSSQQWDQSN